MHTDKGTSRAAARWHWLTSVGATAALSLCAQLPAQTSCTSSWSDQFALPGVEAQISDTVVWDDGTGPAIYAVGDFPFRRIGGIENVIVQTTPVIAVRAAYDIAKWTGRAWEPVGPPIILQSDFINSLQRINTIQVFDPDGAGPASSVLVVGGTPNSASSPSPQSMLQFDGTSWAPFAGQLFRDSSDGNELFDLELYNGDLYACGRFDESGGLSGIARWDIPTQTWNPLAFGIPTTLTNRRVERMAVYDSNNDGTPELFIAGNFEVAVTGGPANKLVRWDGTSLRTVPGWTNTSTVAAANLGAPSILKVVDYGDGPSLLVGDAIYTGLTAPASTRGVMLARLKSGAAGVNGTWSSVVAQSASGNKGYVFAAEMFPGPDGSQLHIGGSRILNGVAGQPPGAKLARRSAAGTFAALGTYSTDLPSQTVRWFLPVDWDFAGPGSTKLLFGAIAYRTGPLGLISGLLPNNIALWNGTSVEFAHSGSDSLSLIPTVIKELDPDGAGPLPTSMYIGHFSPNVDGVTRNSSVVTFDGADYQYTTAGPQLVFAINVFTPAAGSTALYVAGLTAGEPFLSRLNGSAWEQVATADQDPTEFQPASFDAIETATVAGEPSLILSGRFSNIAGVPSRFVARYNGTTWFSMDAGLPTPGTNPNLVLQVNEAPQLVTKFNGELFLTIGWSLFNTTTTIPVFSSAMYRWDGAAWTLVGPNPGLLTVLDLGTGPSMYAFGGRQIAGVAGVDYVGRWNGTTFESIGGAGISFANPVATASAVSGLGVHDFGSGPRLVMVANSAATSGSNAVQGLIRLEGSQWEQVPGGDTVKPATAIYSSTTPGRAGLYVGSAGTKVTGGFESQGIAWLKGPVCLCPADFDGSGVRDVADIFAFLSAWFANAPGSDFNSSGTRDVADIFAFLSAWFAGCP